MAKWGDHSVDVPLRIYARRIDGQDESAKRRIAEALSDGAVAPLPTEPEQDDDQHYDEDLPCPFFGGYGFSTCYPLFYSRSEHCNLAWDC